MNKNLTILISSILICSVVFSCKSTPDKNTDDSGKGEAEVEFERLASLPYASWVEARDDSRGGVAVYQKDKAFPGYNLFCSRNQKHACLYDLEGNCLKRWEPDVSAGEHWQYADIDSEGNFYFLEKRWDAVTKDKKSTSYAALGKLDRDSKVLWYTKGRFHHDFTFLPDGNLIALGRQERIINWKDSEIPILDDEIWVINGQTGEQIERHSIYDLFGQYLSRKQIRDVKFQKDFKEILKKVKERKSSDIIIKHDEPGDVFHINSVVVIDRDIDGFSSKGDYLLSLREPNLVAVLSADFKKVKWTTERVFKKQHQPSLLKEDRILVFDNQWKRGFSRVAEMDVRTKEIVWQYSGEKVDEFFSRTRGGAQRLPNGNTLIADSNQGQLLEVNREGEIVWKYLNENEVEKKGKKLRAAIYRVKRFSKEDIQKLFPEILKEK